MSALLEKLARRRRAHSAARHAQPTTAERARRDPTFDLDAIRRPECGIDLFPVQAEALNAAAAYDGLYAPIPVGNGKSYIALMAGAAMGAPITLALTKAKVVGQLRAQFDELRRHFILPPVRVASYAALSGKNGETLFDGLLERWKPEQIVIVCDEAHAISDPKSARTRRVLRLAKAYPGIRWVMLSGTMLRKSIKDAAHLAELALRDRSPYPSAGVYSARGTAELEQLAAVLDVRAEPSHRDFRSFAIQRITGGEALHGTVEAKQARVRQLAGEALARTPGVVMGQSADIACSLVIVPVDLETPAEISEALDTLKARGQMPDGEVAEDPTVQHAKGRQLSAGFYYVFDWPDGVPDYDWLDARSDWHACVRREIEARGARGYDSALLVAERVERKLARAELVKAGLVNGSAPRLRAVHIAWKRWKVQKVKPEPPRRTVILDRYLAADALAMALKHPKPVVIWYESNGFGEMLRELAPDLPIYDAGNVIPESPAHLCAAKWLCHGTGRNLQAWDTAIIAEPPSAGHQWEQLLGRHHRTGQMADEVTFYVYQHTRPFIQAMESAERKERFAAPSGRERRRLLYADRGQVLKR